MGGQKSKFENYISRWPYIKNDARIPNLAPEFKSDNILPLLWQKELSKMAKYLIQPILDSSMAKKEVKCYPISILRPDLESLHHF